MSTRANGRSAWPLVVFLLALALRLGWLFLADEPLVYQHQQQYFRSALAIVEHPDPIRYVLWSDEWRRWLGTWTIAPLYQLFAAAVFALLGPHLLPLQLLQCAIDAATAVLVGGIGRRAAKHLGAWAGVAYALYWPAVTTPSGTLTENLHTPLLVLSFWLLLRSSSNRGVAAGGFVLGLSALARSVASAFLPLAAGWHVWRARSADATWPAALRGAARLVAGCLLAILPWTARNAFLVGDAVLIDSMGVYNMWDDNSFREGRSGNQHLFNPPSWVFKDQVPESERRARATSESLAGMREHPGLFARKVWDNLGHFLRPDSLYQILVVEQPDTGLRWTLSVLLDDGLLVVGVPLFAVFLVAGRPSDARSLLALWSVYYLLMVVVLFHNEIRYRSALAPFALVGAVAGLELLRERKLGPRLQAAAAALAAAATLWIMLAPLARPLRRNAAMAWSLRGLEADVERRDLAAARARVAAANAYAPRSARPEIRLARMLLKAGQPGEAARAYQAAGERRPSAWIPLLALPRVLTDAGQPEPAAVAVEAAHDFSRRVDPWLALELAWRELDAPLADEIRVGHNDYGAVRGFYRPSDAGRWTRASAWLRLRPTQRAASYDITVVASSPEPAPFAAPSVRIRAGLASQRFTLGRFASAHVLRVPAPADGVLLVRLDALTWNRRGQPPEQGVLVERMTVAAVR